MRKVLVDGVIFLWLSLREFFCRKFFAVFRPIVNSLKDSECPLNVLEAKLGIENATEQKVVLNDYFNKKSTRLTLLLLGTEIKAVYEINKHWILSLKTPSLIDHTFYSVVSRAKKSRAIVFGEN